MPRKLKDGSPSASRDHQPKDMLTRREALVVGAGAAPVLAAAIQQAAAADTEDKAVGPILGHVDHETAIIWYRPVLPGEYVATITHSRTGKALTAKSVSSHDHDLCMTWQFDDLESDTEYTYAITRQGRAVANADSQRIRTAPPMMSQPEPYLRWDRVHPAPSSSMSGRRWQRTTSTL